MSFGSAASDTASQAGNSATSMAADSASSAPSGFSMDVGGTAGNTPVDGTGVSLTPNQVAGSTTYEIGEPSFFDKVTTNFDRFNKGGEQSLGQAYRGFGNNPETYGYAYSKLAGMGRGGGMQTPSAPPLPTQITNNYGSPYESRRRR